MSDHIDVPNSVPVVSFPTNPEELAILLITYAQDWTESLAFFENYCRAKNVPLDSRRVSEIIVELIGWSTK